MNNDSTTPGRVDAQEILKETFRGLEDVPDGLADALLAELSKPDASRAQRIQETIRRAADDRTD